jgi:hypothetical protein
MTCSNPEAALSQVVEFYPVDAGTIDPRSKTGGLKTVRGAAASPVMAGFYNTSPTDLDILTELACRLLGEGALGFMGSPVEITSGGLGGDCFVVSPRWVGLIADIPDGSIDVLTRLWVARLAEEYQGSVLDEGELRRGLHDLVGVCRKAREDGVDVVFVWS